MINISNILERVKKFFDLKTDRHLSDFFGIPKNTLSTWKSRNSADWKLLFEKCEPMDFNYLIKGTPAPEHRADFGGQSGSWSYEKSFKREGVSEKHGNVEIVSHMSDILQQKRDHENTELYRKIEKLEIEKAILLEVIERISGSKELAHKEEV